MKCALLGPSEHATDAEQAQLAERLAALGFAVEARDLGAPPPAGAAVAVVNSKTRVDAAAFAAMPALRLVVTTTSGYDHVDLVEAGRLGVAVARCPLARRDAVVDAALGMGLALLRRLPALARAAQQGRWTRAAVKDSPAPLVRGLTAGVFGYGVIGQSAAAAWRALGARVLVADPAHPNLDAPERLLEESTLVTLHCSLTASSRRMIGRAALARLRPGAILINTARGECVDLDALLAASQLGGFGLDVFDQEPCPRLAELAARENVLLTPHSAGYHDGLGRALNDEVLATLEAWLRGAPLPHEVTAGQDRPSR